MDHCDILFFYVKNQFWPSYNHFLLSPKIDSPLLTTCIRSDDVIEKWPMQANLFKDNSIVIKLNLLRAKLHASSSFQSKDTIEADLPPP